MVRILIVDDEPDLRMLASMMLKIEGHEIDEVESGEVGLEKLKKEKFDLILLDVMMPGEDGWEICKQIKADKRTKDIPVIMCTIRTSSESMERSKECGAVAHIKKPFEIKELVETVEKALSGN